MATFKKAIAEFVGTAILVFIGCGAVMCIGCNDGGSVLLVAVAFGLALLCGAYTVGSISGGHFNPAVSFAMLICGKMNVKDFFVYLAAQFLGAFAGSGLLALIFGLVNNSVGRISSHDYTYGSNGLYALGGSFASGLVTELLLTFVFVLVVLFVALKQGESKVGGLLCALALTAVHLVGIKLTGTSVNPARSFGPVMVTLISGNRAPLIELWVFLLAPMAGAAAAALLFRFLTKEKT